MQRPLDSGRAIPASPCGFKKPHAIFETSEQPLSSEQNSMTHFYGRSRKRRRRPLDHEDLRRAKKKLRRMAQLTDLLLLRRYELQHEDQTLMACGNFVAKSAEELEKLVKSVLNNTQLDLSSAQLDGSFARFKADIATFEAKASHIQNLRYETTQDETRLKARTQKLRDLLNNTSLSLDLHSLEELQGAQLEIESNTSSAHSTVESSTPTLLAQFYDSAGDVRIYQERLAELEYNFQESVIERDMIQDRGDEVDTSDEEFRAKYMRERKIIQDDLEKAEHEAAELKLKCEKLGLEIAAHEKESSSEVVSRNAHDIFANIDPPMAASDTLFRQRSFRDVYGHSADHNEARIRTWLQTLPQEHQSSPRLELDQRDEGKVRNTDHKQSNLRLWRRYCINDVVTAADSIPVTSGACFNRSTLDVGLSLRRWKSDPSCLYRLSDDPEPAHEVPIAFPLRSYRSSVEDPSSQRLFSPEIKSHEENSTFDQHGD